MSAKAPDAFRTISEAAEELDLPHHVLRHWETTFSAVRPLRRAGGRRFYRPQDIKVLAGIKALLHIQKFTTKGVNKIFKDHGVAYVAALGSDKSDTPPKETPPKNTASREPIASAKDTNMVQIPRRDIQMLADELNALKAELATLRKKPPHH